MSGVAVIRYLIANDADVLAVLPATRIMAGDLPLKTAAPAIAITQVSSGPYNLLRPNETPKLHTDRVQVTVIRKAPPDDDGYPGLQSLLALIEAACPCQRGSVNSISVDSIIPEGQGPDLPIPELSLFTRSMDFLVRWVQGSAVPATARLTEDGGVRLAEDGSIRLTEGT